MLQKSDKAPRRFPRQIPSHINREEKCSKASTSPITKLASDFTDDLPRDLALSIVFRIGQESRTNIHRHSESPTALVQIDRSPREITLVVEDEGKGMPAEIKSTISSGELTGVGLRGMRERVGQFGGNLEVRSNGNGTRVVAIQPIPKAPDEQDKAPGHSEKATSYR